MEIEVAQEKLTKALNSVSRVAPARATLPILNNILIKVQDKKVSLIATNLDMAIIDYLPVSNSQNGTITVPAQIITEFISNLPKDAQIKITSKDNKISINSGKYSSVINGTSAEDFPELPEIDEKSAVVFKINIEEFKNSINQVITAVNHDLNRPALTGVHFYTKDNTLYLGSTDGYRVTKKKLINNVKSEVKVTIPAATLQEVLRDLTDEMEEVEISLNEDLVRFRLGEIEIISKLIDAEYPDLEKLISINSEVNLTVNRDELLRVTKLASLFARHSTNDIIACETNSKSNTFSIRSITNEYGENDSVLETDIDKDGKIFIPSRYLIDAINSINGVNISIGFSEGVDKITGIKRPMVIKEQNSDDYIHIIMPLNDN